MNKFTLRRGCIALAIAASLGGVALTSSAQQAAPSCPSGMLPHVFSGANWPASLIPTGSDSIPPASVAVAVPGASGQVPTMTLLPGLQQTAAGQFNGSFFARGFSSAPTATIFGFGIRATGVPAGTVIPTGLSFSVPVYNLSITLVDIDYTPAVGAEIVSSVVPATGWTFGPAPTSPANFTSTATDIRPTNALVGCVDWNSAACDVRMTYGAGPLTAAAFGYTSQTAGATGYLREISFCLPAAAAVPTLSPWQTGLLIAGLALTVAGFSVRSLFIRITHPIFWIYAFPHIPMKG